MRHTARIVELPVRHRAPPPPEASGWLTTATDRIVRPKAAVIMLGISKATLYRLIADEPTFPKPRRISTRVTGWLESELLAYIASKRPVMQQPPLS